MKRIQNVFFSLFAISSLLIIGCENESSAPVKDDGRAQSVLGKARQKATDTVDAMEQRQLDLSRQADEIFDGN